MKSVLILGSKGMLGQELVSVFSQDNAYSVTAWDREEMDVTDTKTLRAKVMDLWPDVIVNATAYNAVDACENNPEEKKKAEMLNTRVPGELASIANDLQAVLVHYSTDYVFDGSRPKYRVSGRRAPGCCGTGCAGCSYNGPEEGFDGYREEDMPNPLNVYGKTKYEGEKLVEKNSSHFYIIRLSKLFGKPASIEGAKRSFFEVMLGKGKEYISKRGQGVSVDPISVVDGEMSSFTYAPDLAEASKKLIESELASGIYHLVNSGSATWYAAVTELYKQAGLDILTVPVSSDTFVRPAKRPGYSVLINKKTEPMRSYREAIADFLKNFS